MSLPPDHHAEALAALKLIQAADNPVAEMASASEATAHALLALVEQVAEVGEQLKLVNVIAAFGAGIDLDCHPLEMGSADVHAAIVYLHSRIGDIVNPGTEAL